MEQLNSIYDSYQRVTDKYYTAKPIQGTRQSVVTYSWEPFARQITVPGYEDYDFFILRRGKEYGLFEGLTGTLMITQTRIPGMDLRRTDIKAISEQIKKRLDIAGGKALINIGMTHAMRMARSVSPRFYKTEYNGNTD